MEHWYFPNSNPTSGPNMIELRPYSPRSRSRLTTIIRLRSFRWSTDCRTIKTSTFGRLTRRWYRKILSRGCWCDPWVKTTPKCWVWETGRQHIIRNWATVTSYLEKCIKASKGTSFLNCHKSMSSSNPTSLTVEVDRRDLKGQQQTRRQGTRI